VNFCSLLGALAGSFTFGLVPLAIFLFPMVMALSMKTVASWEWMPPLKKGEKPRRGLGLLILAPLCTYLLTYPILYLLLIPLTVILTPFVLLYHSGRGPDDASFDLAAIGAFVAVLASYFWLLARSLKRFTGAWHRWLFVRLIAWISGIVAVEFLLTRHFNGFGFPSAPMYSANNFWLFVVWILSTLALSRAGASFGLWLAHPN